MNGYSDRINHAFAFAAKHLDRQVRKGTRLPYLTHPANVAVMLTRYGRDEETVVAGILYDVVDDSVREGSTREMLEERIAEKFGDVVLETLLGVVTRRFDDTGNELDADERRADFLERLASASEPALWVSAADMVHNGNSLLTDLRRTVDASSVWSRFALGRAGVIRWYRTVLDRMIAVGFTGAILAELREVVEALETFD
jgi:(p)ppGpp synthase/HD superfamily hydrolase